MSDEKKKPQEDQTTEVEATEVETAAVTEPETSSDKQEQAAEEQAEIVTDDAVTEGDKDSAVTGDVQDKPDVQKTAAANAAEPENKEKQKKPATWPGKLALLISIIALASAGYLYWLSLHQTSTAAQNNAAIEAQINTSLNDARSSLDKVVAEVNQKLGQLQSQAQTDKAETRRLNERLTKSIQQVTATQHTNRADWQLAEVEYLLRLANQRVLMEQTTDGALQLLKSADKIIKEIDDTGIYDVRKALAEDIAALEAVPKLDTEGVFLKLGALNKQVPNLRLIPISAQRKLPELLEEVTPEAIEESWTTGLQESWSKVANKLDKLVVIQHRDKPVEPLLSPQQTYYLQQNLHLMLEQAQLALLQRKQASYDASLSKAHEWVATYFEEKDGTTQSLLRGISALQEVKVTAEMPDISASLRALKSYLSYMTKLKEQGAS
ncbi:MAG: heme biosynthesis protein [Neptuniibacter caesariensis]|uniref:Heme biosynthesis protein n=1 Tax=Neptuniibacter caesariensis TaxID=207954 RepID=A0A2G6JAJ3_NEPCE|nr:MAG: heme biosynthesis protein [Neptuniibacter caesariensis]